MDTSASKSERRMTGSKALAFRAEFPAPILVPTSRVYPFFFRFSFWGHDTVCDADRTFACNLFLLVTVGDDCLLAEASYYPPLLVLLLGHLVRERNQKDRSRRSYSIFFFIFTILLCLNKCFPQNFANVTLNRGSAGNRRLCGDNQLKWRLDLKFTLNLFCTSYEPPCGSP
jgi:hypothetical protein